MGTTQQPWAARLVFTRLRGPHTLHTTAATPLLLGFCQARRGAFSIPQVSGATRVVTVVDTVRSKLAASRARRKAAVPARGRRGGVVLVTAAALGPVSADAIAAYVGLGYG